MEQSKPSLTNNKGFTIIGVLVASVLGLIVVAGLTQMMVHLSGSVTQIENQFKRTLFIDEFKKMDCNETFKNAEDLGSDGHFPNPRKRTETITDDILTSGGNTHKVYFKQLFKADGSEFVNLEDRRKMNQKYGFNADRKSELKFMLKCTDSTNDCKCDKKTSPCEKEWELSLNSQRETLGAYIYNEPIMVSLKVTATDTSTTCASGQGPSCISSNATFECPDIRISGGGGNNQNSGDGNNQNSGDGNNQNSGITIHTPTPITNCLNPSGCETDLGEHKFCALSDVKAQNTMQQGGCTLTKSGSDWKLKARGTWGNPITCSAICFDD